MGGWVYILTNRRNGTLYVGATVDLARRAREHREGVADGFTKRYGLRRLVYAEHHTNILSAKLTSDEHKALAARLESSPDPSR
jgi:putative endonuclease